MSDRITRNDFLKFAGLGAFVPVLGSFKPRHSKNMQGGSLKIDTWGDSITAANEFQPALAEELNIPTTNISNHGISSDFSEQIRKRFVNYYTANPEEIYNFQVLFPGTNNLRKYFSRTKVWTTGNSVFNSIQPNYDERYGLMFTQSYKDQMLRDLRIILDLIPHHRYLIIPGHISSSASRDADNFKAMEEFDNFLLDLYPNNAINLRYKTIQEWDYLDTILIDNFYKPKLGSTVTITVSNTSWMGDSAVNGSSRIAIGTKQRYDIYDIVGIHNGTKVTVKLTESNLPFAANETIRHQYNFVSDLGRDEVMMHLRVYSYDDIVSFQNNEIPDSMTREHGVHPTHEGYKLVGKIFADKIKKILS